MSLPTFTLSYVNTPAYYTGTGFSSVVPSVFPCAINGRPYMIDQKSGKFARVYEQRVRDSQDISTAPGEAAINPGGLWRRGQDSWHLGAGQRYADTADAQDFRFLRSKGINPWTKGQVSLLNATQLALSTSNTNLKVMEVNGYVYVADGQTLKYTTNPFGGLSTSWTSVTTGAPTASIHDIATDGVVVYVAYDGKGVYTTTVGGSSLTKHYPDNSDVNYTKLGFAKGFMLAFHQDTTNSHIHVVPLTPQNKGTPVALIRYKEFVCTGIVGGQNFIYVSGYNTDVGLVYRLSLKTDATIDSSPIVALELPTGEYPTCMYSYLGFVLLGTNLGVRFCSSDAAGNLIAGSLISTNGSVNDFTAEDKYVWFGWTNYDSSSSGLGRLDLSVFTSANTPAYASDLMYGSTNPVRALTSFQGKRIFTVSGVGVVAEDATNIVNSGTLESGVWRWGIPDRKFVAKVDARTEPLVGSVKAEMRIDSSSYDTLDTWTIPGSTEYTFEGTNEKAIEAGFRFTLIKSSGIAGPVLTRWMARAYVAPFRSQVFSIPVILHNKIKVRDREYHFDVTEELNSLDDLISSPRVVVFQLGTVKYPVIVEDIEWAPLDSYGNTWEWEGTATVTMRSVEK